MRFLVVGDVHYPRFNDFVIHVRNVIARGIEFDAIIQCGDFGIYEGSFKPMKQALYRLKLNKPIYFVDGNHEDHGYLHRSIEKFSKIGVHFQPRSSITTLDDGCKIGWFGGAFNVDRHQFKFDDGSVNYPTPDEINLMAKRIKDVGGVDLLVTHSNPCGIGIGIHGDSFLCKNGAVFVQLEGYEMAPVLDCGDITLTNLWNQLGEYKPKTWIFAHHHCDYHNKVENTDFYCVGHCESVGIRRMPTVYIFDSIEKKML